MVNYPRCININLTIDYRIEGKGWETPVILHTHPRFTGTKIYRVNTYPYLLALTYSKTYYNFLIFAYTCQNGNSLIIIIIYSCCCRSAYAIDHAPTDAGGACKTSSQRTRARTTRDHTILITIQFLLPSLPYQ